MRSDRTELRSSGGPRWAARVAALLAVLTAAGITAFAQTKPPANTAPPAAKPPATNPLTAKPGPATQPPLPPAATQPGTSAPGASKAAPAKPATTPPKTVPAKPAPKKEEKKPPAPERVTLETKDYWRIHGTYYAPMEGLRKGREVIPIIMVHGWEGQSGEYSQLAVELQYLGFASLAIDLRGHGRSTTKRRPGTDGEEIKYDDLKPGDLATIGLDLETAKRFLLEKHNAEQVNIELLCVIAAEAGCIVAMEWAAMDWSWPMTAMGKQGQDVQALVLLSPRRTFKGMNAAPALQHVALQQHISVMIAVGSNDSSALSEVKRIQAQLDRRPPLPDDPQERLRKQSLFLFEAPTNLQGTRLLAPQLPIAGGDSRKERYLQRFLYYRLFSRTDEFPWKERKSPLGN